MARLSIVMVLMVLVIAVSAEAPQFRQFRANNRFLARQEVATATATATGQESPKPAPYAAAGIRPGRAFELPTETKAATNPSTSYGPPAQAYGPPNDEIPTGPEAEVPEAENGVEEPSEAVDLARFTGENVEETKGAAQPGFYFVQLPTGGFQKVAILGAPVASQALIQAQPVLLQPQPVPQTIAYVAQYSQW